MKRSLSIALWLVGNIKCIVLEYGLRRVSRISSRARAGLCCMYTDTSSRLLRTGTSFSAGGFMIEHHKQRNAACYSRETDWPDLHRRRKLSSSVFIKIKHVITSSVWE